MPQGKKVLANQFKAQGKSGTYFASGILAEDHLSELIGNEQHEIYNKMLRSDTQVGKIEAAVVNPIKSAKWDIEPASDETADLEAAALIKQILFEDLPRGWKGKLDEILTYPFHGFAAFEVIHENKDHPELGPYTGLKNLAFRDQKSLVEWRFNKDDETLIEVNQKQIGDLEVDVWIKGENLMIFYNNKKGSDLGFPILRRMYGPYKRKLLAKQLQIIGIERSAIPSPKLTVPKSIKFGSEEYVLAESQLRSYTNGETSYFMLPEGWELDLQTNQTFNPSNVQTVIKDENEAMAGSILATFLEMGIGGNSGNQASTKTLSDFYNKGLSYLADNIINPINAILIPQLMQMNFGDNIGTFPKLVYSGITEEAGKELMEVVTGFINSGTIGNDELLEDHIRKTYSLPNKAEGEAVENGESEDGNDDRPGSDVDVSGGDTNTDTSSNNGNEVELSIKNPKNPKDLIRKHSDIVNKIIIDALNFSGDKFIADTTNRYKQLGPTRKQAATDKIKIGGKAKFKKALRLAFNEAAADSIAMAKKEVPVDGEVKFSSKEIDFKRIAFLMADETVMDFQNDKPEGFPPHIAILLNKQADLISESAMAELESLLKFKFSAAALNTDSINAIIQELNEGKTKFVEAGTRASKGTNASSLIVNESRNAWFRAPEVLAKIESYTFTNDDPKSDICVALAGKTFAANDTKSMEFAPPLHHNCKSFLVPNTTTQKRQPEIGKLAPSEKAQKSITL